uniref:Bm3692 n=1 Tax=Brugia malayi TaxID=6279 RepID=A0A0H5S983_BRUMA|nr:Bm3692 [Brugia malayi]
MIEGMGIGDFIEIGFDCCSCLSPLCVYMDVFARWTIECGKQLPMLFVDLIKDTTNVEYVKLIVSCLYYGSEDSFNRFILQTALTSANVAGRKWATQFLSILASHNISDFSVWGIKLLLGQLADPSAKVVRHALRLLHRWIPHYLESVYLIKDICFDIFGDAGILLKTYLFSNESYVKDNSRDVLATLDYWKRKFNMRYVEIVDEDVRVALLDSKRSINGQYARSSNERVSKLGVPMPVHLYGQLVQHDTGRELLLRSNEVDRLLDVLRDSPLPTDTYQTSKLKGALYALGHIVANLNPSLLPMETVPIICRFAECCPVLSIRGSAFWVLNLIGNTQLGSVLLLSLGWESSNFIIGEKKSNMLLLKAANIDINKIWIRCIDEKLPSQQEINLKTFGVDLVSSTFITNKNGTVPFTDYGTLWHRKMNCSIETRHVSSCVTFELESRLFNHGNISVMEMEGIREDCLMVRTQFRLPSFSFDTALNYTAISDNKFLCLCGFLNPLESKHRKLSRKTDSETTKSRPVNFSDQSISLPLIPDFFLKNVFLGDEFTEQSCNSSIVKHMHQISNCFYCSWPEEYFGSKNVLEVEVPSEARDEIISMFLLQESKCLNSSKKLLRNYLSNREVFSSICLYSDVLVLLAQHNFSLETRRLVHELFADALKKLSFRETCI